MSLVSIIREVPFPELEQMLRRVPLVSDKAKRPYEKAAIRVRDVLPSEVNPIAFYVTQRQLDFQRALHEELEPQGYDTLHLRTGLELINMQGERWLLTPPVTEIDHDEVFFRNVLGDIDYSKRPMRVKMPILVDGLHRFLLARERKEAVLSFSIADVDPSMPVGALPNAWEDIKVYTDVPKTVEEKKLYRTKVAYHFYRDFDSVGMGRRKLTGEGELLRKGGEQFNGVQAVGFDLDHTLYPDLPEYRRAVRGGFYTLISQRRQIPIGDAERLFEDTYAQLRASGKTLEACGIENPREAVRDCMDLARVDLQLRQDARLVGMLQRLQQHYRLFLITDSRVVTGTRKLNALGIDEKIFNPGMYWDLPAQKPGAYKKDDGSAFAYVQQQLGLPPSAIAFVGNSEEDDIMPSSALGWKTVKVGKESAHATATVKEVYDIERLLL